MAAVGPRRGTGRVRQDHTLVPVAGGGRATQRRVAWLALDPGDGDLRLFLTHLVAAIQTAEPEAGADALALLEAGASMCRRSRTNPLNQAYESLTIASMAARASGLVGS